jgi:hypothetical protein
MALSSSLRPCPPLLVLVVTACWAVGCQSTHEKLGPESGSVTQASCGVDAGVSVDGEVRFTGVVPERARLWVFFSDPAGSIPPCSTEIVPATFPAAFRFGNVTDKLGNLYAFLDLDGGFPPLPDYEDEIFTVPHAQLDFQNGTSGLVLTLHLNTDDEAGTAHLLHPDTGAEVVEAETASADGLAEEGGGPTLHEGACKEDGGVTVSGEVRYSGEVPAGAVLWLSFKGTSDVIPPCSLKVTAPAFPAAFSFGKVPQKTDWTLTALLDLDGGFPPVPEAGDPIAAVPPDQLDLTHNVSGLELDLTPYAGR